MIYGIIHCFVPYRFMCTELHNALHRRSSLLGSVCVREEKPVFGFGEVSSDFGIKFDSSADSLNDRFEGKSFIDFVYFLYSSR